VYDKTVRRRRAVLVALVAFSLILLTAYFGESPDGRLHAVQRGFLTVVSPIQEGANAALKPVRKLFGWLGDALHAKRQRDELRTQNARLIAELVGREDDARAYKGLLRLLHLDGGLHISDYRPVAADVVEQSPNLWYATVGIDRGTSSGIQVNDPVIDGEGVIGKVTLAASDSAQVSLITDSAVAVSAMIYNTRGALGLVVPKVGDPNTLVMEYLPTNAPVVVGDYVVTSGTIEHPHESLFPKGIPIGQVSAVGEEAPYKNVEVTPSANLHGLEAVQVLTQTPGTAQAGGQSTEATGAGGEGRPGSTGGGN
jgi:rod shape-determining protein MreC